MNETTRIPKSDCAFVRFRFGGRLIAGLALAGGLFAGAADAQVEVYALRVGDGTAVDAAYKPFSIMQFSGGSDSLSFSNSWDAPSTDAADRITIGGSFTTYAYLNRSLDGNLLTFAGRDVAVDGSTSDAESIVIGSFSLQNRTFDTSTRIPSDGSGYRAAVTTDGSEFWYSGQGGGVHYAMHGQTTPTTSILTTGAGNPSNIETAGVQIINNTIMFGRRAGSDRGIQVMPEGLHRTHGEDRAVIPGSGWKRTAADTP